MSAGIYNIVSDQGATFAQTLTWKDANGTAINLTGYTARMQVREKYSSVHAVLSLTTENGRIALGGSAGTIALAVSAADMAALSIPDAPGSPPAKSLVYDLELVAAGGQVTKLLMGTFTVRREVTR
jgi:hypothetical protein